METVVRKKRGPVARAGRVRVTLYLDTETAEWGKHQGDGLSDLVRRLLAEAQGRTAADARDDGDDPTATDPYSPELRATYQRLIERKLRAGLDRDEEQELARTRERINAADRQTHVAREQQQGAAAIDQELSDLRREIASLAVLLERK